MDNNTKAAVREVIARDVILLALVMLCNALAKGIFPDDEDDDLFVSLYYIARSVGMEFTSMFAPGVGYGFIGKYESPMAMLGFIGDMIGVIIMVGKDAQPLDKRTKAIWGPNYETNIDVALARTNPLNNFNPFRFMDVNKAQYRKMTGNYPANGNMKPKVDVKLDSRILPKGIYDVLFGNVEYKTEKEELKKEQLRQKNLQQNSRLSDFQRRLKGTKANEEYKY